MEEALRRWPAAKEVLLAGKHVVADEGNRGSCAALQWAAPGRQSRGQGVGGRRWVDGGLEIAVTGARQPNP